MAFVVPLIPYIMAAGAVVSTYAAIKQGQAASDAASYNAKQAQQNAQAVQQQGEQAAIAQRREMGLKLGSLSANAGASGIDPSTGSPLDALSSSIQQGTLDNLNLKYNYQMKALGYNNTATLDTMQASNDSTAGYLNAAGAALGGAAQAGQAYANNSPGSRMYGGGIPVAPGP
jgi:hypothetical protein